LVDLEKGGIKKYLEPAISLAEKYNVLAIHRHKDKGYGNSVKEGLRKAIEIKSNIAITLDSDFSHNPNLIPEMIKEIGKGYDLVIGSRRVKGGEIVRWNWWRHLCSKGASYFGRLMLGLKTKDIFNIQPLIPLRGGDI